jgi:hypothetical protein
VSAKTRTLGRIVASVQRRNDGSRRSSGIGRTVRRTTTRCEMSCSTLRVERVPDSKSALPTFGDYHEPFVGSL